MTRKFEGDQILVATHNKGKLQEITEILAPYGVKVIGAAEMDLPEPEETEDTFVGKCPDQGPCRCQGDWPPCSF